MIAPKKCYWCQKQWHFFCPQCLKKLRRHESICHVCKKETINFQIHEVCKNDVYYDSLFIAFHYKNKILKKMVHDTKFYSKKDIFEDMWLYLWELFKESWVRNIDNSIVCCVPLHFIKKLKRWYNQADILARNFSESLGIQYEKTILKKVKHTWQQSHLSRGKRLENTKNSFVIAKNMKDKIDNKTVILCDDIVSTWSTINEISKVLKKSWAKNVIACVLASD